jgi:hypothetical protein
MEIQCYRAGSSSLVTVSNPTWVIWCVRRSVRRFRWWQRRRPLGASTEGASSHWMAARRLDGYVASAGVLVGTSWSVTLRLMRYDRSSTSDVGASSRA